MILYLDASALVKRYIAEAGSTQVSQAIASADVVGTALISRAEVAAALAKAVRAKALESEKARASLLAFRRDWLDLVRIQITEPLVARADVLAWERSLRGYDAVQLAAASLWQETMGETVTLATFDQSLWSAAEQVGLLPFPSDLRMLVKKGSKRKT